MAPRLSKTRIKVSSLVEKNPVVTTLQYPTPLLIASIWLNFGLKQACFSTSTLAFFDFLELICSLVFLLIKSLLSATLSISRRNKRKVDRLKDWMTRSWLKKLRFGKKREVEGSRV